ncbi:penicillin-binding protein [Ramlibacter sp. RBP-2]|uniref:Penicillin-binding protein n=1 Tax=Ramlibacter lithotrophicus TaxID=2606681 RepID=A0A7X6DG09_9BURK|nr:transglycosylase domain-containing protein [Ramlibacter lithotrophicus]NKE66348.1 penicillin-binding protein [Ramlibacter lithotrophicus]
MKQALSRLAAFLVAFGYRVGGALRRHPWRAAAVLPLLPLLYVLALVPFTPGIGDIRKARTQQPAVVLTADGKELAVFRRVNREWVELREIAPHVVKALLATEDHRFYQHHGIDLRRTLAAAASTLAGDREGGSTITQQLARNLYPEEIGRAPTITRKVKEAITALKIESAYSKDEILESYLNTVPFLYNAHGIEMAARTYFDKPARQLDVLEGATLVGMLKGTSHYNPVLNPERSLQRRNIVLAQMARHGQLTPGQLEGLRKQPLKVDFERQEDDPGPAPHLAQQLRRWLIDWSDRNGYDMHADGLVVHTTIDSRLQQMALEAVERQGDRLQATASAAWKPTANRALLQAFLRETRQFKEQREGGASEEQALKKLEADGELVRKVWADKTRLQAGFMALDPASGHVKAWVGSRDFRQDQFDHVDQARRQPGSTFKPFVYGAAFEDGISPDELLMDAPVEIRIDARTVWKPTDIDGSSGQPMSVRDGLVQSKNTITAQVMQRVGPSRIAQVARAMGVRHSKLDAVPSLALGTSPVTLKEMVASYGTIVNSGSYVEPLVVTRIERAGQGVVAEFRPRAAEQGLSTHAAQTLLDVMRGVVDRGTGVGIRSRFGLKGDLAGKTGTTQDYTDGWFILMHPQLVSGAWVGFNDNRITMRESWGQGSRNALNIVGDFAQQSQKARFLDAKAAFAAPRQPPQAFDGSLFGRVNEWLGGVFPGQQVQEAQPLPPLPPQEQVVQPGVILEPAPASPVATIPSPAAGAEPVERPPTVIMSGPPAQRGAEFQWQVAPPRSSEPAPLPRGSEPAALPPGASESRRTPGAERGSLGPPAAVILPAEPARPGTDRPAAVIIQRPDGGSERRGPPVVEFTPQAARERPAVRIETAPDAPPSSASPAWTDGSTGLGQN